MNLWIVLLILIVLYPVAWYFVHKDADKQRKKEEEYYKDLEYKRKSELYDLLQEAERDAEIEAKLKKMREEYKENKPD